MKKLLWILVTIALVGWPSSIYMIRQVRGVALSTWDQVIIAGGFAGASRQDLGAARFRCSPAI